MWGSIIGAAVSRYTEIMYLLVFRLGGMMIGLVIGLNIKKISQTRNNSTPRLPNGVNLERECLCFGIKYLIFMTCLKPYTME